MVFPFLVGMLTKTRIFGLIDCVIARLADDRERLRASSETAGFDLLLSVGREIIERAGLRLGYGEAKLELSCENDNVIFSVDDPKEFR
jgi:hypothetical protein